MLCYVQRPQGAQQRVIRDHPPDACIAQKQQGIFSIKVFGRLVENHAGNLATFVGELTDAEVQIDHRVRRRSIGHQHNLRLEAVGDIDVQLRSERMRRISMQAFDYQHTGVLPGGHAQGDDFFEQFAGLVGGNPLCRLSKRQRLGHRNLKKRPRKKLRIVRNILIDRFGKCSLDTQALQRTDNPQRHRRQTDRTPGRSHQKNLRKSLTHLFFSYPSKRPKHRQTLTAC